MSRAEAFALLGLDSSATSTAIRARYRELIRRYHPDRNSDRGALEKTRAIIEAYEIATAVPGDAASPADPASAGFVHRREAAGDVRPQTLRFASEEWFADLAFRDIKDVSRSYALRLAAQGAGAVILLVIAWATRGVAPVGPVRASIICVVGACLLAVGAARVARSLFQIARFARASLSAR